MVKDNGYSNDELQRRRMFAITTYVLLLVIILIILFLHVFKVSTITTDKFSFFIVSLLFILLLLPSVTYIKAFGFMEVRKDTRVMVKQDNKGRGKMRTMMV